MSETILGNHLKVSKIGFGCMGLSHANGKPVDTENAITIIKKAYELGYTFLIPLKHMVLKKIFIIMKK